MNLRREAQQRGAILPLVVVMLPALLGVAALTVDLGLLALAAQQAQDVADAAALGAVSELPDYTSARATASSLVEANNESSAALQAACSSANGDIAFWGPHETIPDYGALGSSTYGVRVTVHIPVEYVFAPVLGLTGATVTRNSTALRVRAGAAPIVPMWMSYEPPLDPDADYGVEREMLMASDPAAANIPGSFGWLEPLSGSFIDLLRGYDLTPAQVEANQLVEGDVLTAYTGLSVGQWRAALDYANDGLARLQRATDPEGPWAGDTFEDFHTDNPRIVLVPLVEYVGGTGSGAQFVIREFAAFWIESIDSHGNPQSIIGRFIKYQIPGRGEGLGPEGARIWTAKLVM